MQTNPSTMNTRTTVTTKTMVLTGVMAAVMCIMGPLSIAIPISPVPLSLTNFAIYITIYVLSTRLGTCSFLIYLLLGLVGLPVFSAFTGGPAKLLGPTGGYIIGFIPMALICGFFIDRFFSRRLFHFLGMVLGTAVCYLFGTLWLSFQAGLGFYAALWAGVIPFIPGDLIKIVISMIAGPALRIRLRKAGLVGGN